MEQLINAATMPYIASAILFTLGTAFLGSILIFIVGGTSLTVWPASTFLNYFKGDHLIIVNNEPLDVPTNERTDLIITDTLGNVFTKIDDVIKE